MRTFDYVAPAGVPEALAAFETGSAYLAGGTTLVDLMKLDVLAPRRVLDIGALPLRGIRHDTGGLFLGALERLRDVIEHPAAAAYPMLVRALERSASPQIRDMATVGGNLLQRTRCGYFRDTAAPCNKRAPGSGCPAAARGDRSHAVLGTSDYCVATHPSDLAVALTALDAVVEVTGEDGDRRVPLAAFYLDPGSAPHREHVLRPGELVAGVTVPDLPWARRSTYVKVRDRASYDFALASAAVALDLAPEDGAVRAVRVAVGGVATRPWRLPEVERALAGGPASPEAFEGAVGAIGGFRPLPGNAFKPELLRRTVVRALTELSRTGPGQEDAS